MTDAPRTTARRAAVSWRPGRALRCSTALLAASALALTGCSSGSDDAGGAAAPAPASSSSASSSSPTAAPSATGTASSGTAAAVVDAVAASRDAGSGTFGFSSETSAGGQVVTATGEGSFDSAAGALQMQLTSQLPGQGDIAVELRQVDGTAYVSGLPQQPAGQWVEVPLEELGAASGPLGGADPSQQLSLLDHVADDVEEVGQEDVGGVQATHYTGSVDLEAAAEQAQQEGADADQLREQYEQLGLSTIPFDLFVGPDGLPVRMATTVATSAQGQQVSSTSTVDFADWGSPVQVAAPEGAVPLSEVTGAPTPAG